MRNLWRYLLWGCCAFIALDLGLTVSQLASIRYRHTARGQVQVESKDEDPTVHAFKMVNCDYSLSNLERAVKDKLSSTTRDQLDMAKDCAAKQRILDALATLPADQRDEDFAHLLDLAQHHHASR